MAVRIAEQKKSYLHKYNKFLHLYIRVCESLTVTIQTLFSTIMLYIDYNNF